MMDIVFRGKRVDNGRWVYGFYGHKPNGNEVEEHFIIEWELNRASDLIYTYFVDTPVIPETVGQYTGHDDKNGKKIFGGDVLVYNGDKFLIFWDKERAGFYLNYWQYDEQYDFSEFWPTSEIIGNIHDNPELMEVTE